MSNLLTRIAVALVAIPIALGLVWYGGLPLALLVTEMLPPCALIKRSDMQRPKPVPPFFVVKNSTKILSRPS